MIPLIWDSARRISSVCLIRIAESRPGATEWRAPGRRRAGLVDPLWASVYHHAVKTAPTIDPLLLAQALIRRPSVTPEDAGALDVLDAALKPLGFVCHRLRFSHAGTADVDNLYARLGTDSPHLCYAGHTDVVPIGDPGAWRVDPFAAEVIDGMLWGRGAADMKGAIACFVAAVARRVSRGPVAGSISLLITGDEEGPAINRTAKVLRWMGSRRLPGGRADQSQTCLSVALRLWGCMFSICSV